jgi:hypothetical protein
VALIGNHSVLSKHPGTNIGGGAIGLGMDRSGNAKVSRMRAAFTHSGWDPKSGVPDGLTPPYSWVLPLTAGGMSARKNLRGTGALTGSIAQGINIVAPLAGTGSVASALTMVVGLTSAIAGTGSVTASLVGIVQMASALAGTGSVSANLGALAYMVGALSGTGAVSANLKGKSWMEASISTFTELSPESLAASVWNAAAASYNATGSMGEKLNDAGSATNPWTEVIEGTYTAAELLRIMSAALAGELSGAGTTTITITGVDGTTDRITATVTADGDRTAVTLDGA